MESESCCRRVAVVPPDLLAHEACKRDQYGASGPGNSRLNEKARPGRLKPGLY